MSKTKSSISELHPLSADRVVAHAERQETRGKNPSMPYKGERNPKVALDAAKADIAARGEVRDFYYNDLPGRVAVLHVINENQTVPAESFGKVLVGREEGSYRAAAFVIEVARGFYKGPIREGQQDGTLHVNYHYDPK